MDILVPAVSLQPVKFFLKSQGLDYSVTIEDLQVGKPRLPDCLAWYKIARVDSRHFQALVFFFSVLQMQTLRYKEVKSNDLLEEHVVVERACTGCGTRQIWIQILILLTISCATLGQLLTS